MKTLLVLAASEHQIPVIRAAKALGVRVLTTDNRPNNPGHALADASFGVDTTAPEAVLELARAQKIDGILSACTDVAVPTAAFVAEKLGLVGIPLAAAHTCTDKLKFRAFADIAGLPNGRWTEVRADTPVPTELLATGLCVLKPADSSGSKGIFVVDGAHDFAARLPDTLAFARDGRAIVEQWIEGQQGTVEGILRDGEVVWGMVTQRMTAPRPYTATWGHEVPSGHDDQTIENLRAVITRLFAALGITSGPFDCDIVISGGQTYILEMSPRLGGNALSDLARVCAGLDLPDYAVRHALGLPTEIAPSPIRPAAAVLLGVDTPGALAMNVAAIDELRALDWVVELRLDRAPGDAVLPFINGRHRVAAALITAPDTPTLHARRDELKARLAIHSR